MSVRLVARGNKGKQVLRGKYESLLGRNMQSDEENPYKILKK